MNTPSLATVGNSRPTAEPQTEATTEFNGKRALVTGGTKGIGEAIVSRLARGGATVIATARSVPAGVRRERFIQADVSTREGADQVIKATLDRLGGLDILINSVGGSSAPSGGALALTDDALAAGVRPEPVLGRPPGPGLPAVDARSKAAASSSTFRPSSGRSRSSRPRWRTRPRRPR